MIWSFNCFPIQDLIGSTSNLLNLEDLGSILIDYTVSFLSRSVPTSGVVSLIGPFLDFTEFSVETLGFLSLLLLKTLGVGCEVVSSNSSNWTSLYR